MAQGCDLESEQLGEARSGGLSDEDSVSSHSSPRAAGTKTAGMSSELSPYDSPIFSRNGDDYSAATPTDNEVSKYSFFEIIVLICWGKTLINNSIRNQNDIRQILTFIIIFYFGY